MSDSLPTYEWFARHQWLKHWAGPWSILNTTLLGYQYTAGLTKPLGANLHVAMFISHRGYSVAYLERDAHAAFGRFLATKVVDDPTLVDSWARHLKAETDRILSLIKAQQTSATMTATDYQAFIDAFYAYGVPHRAIKIVVDFLTPEQLDQYLPTLSEARVYSEPVYAETEAHKRYIAEQIAAERSLTSELVLATTKDEMDQYWQTGELPERSVLEDRFDAAAVLYQDGVYELVTGAAVSDLERQLEASAGQTTELRGATAYPGIVEGRVRIVLNPQGVSFEPGEILVTGMTRPEYLPLIEQAAGFITDAGGMLSHAAITARELQKPCVVGTQLATKTLRDGDVVTLDATHGVVRIQRS